MSKMVATKRSIADKFQELLKNLRTQNDGTVALRRRAITRRLNQDFWSSNSETDHTRFIGSYGHGTEIRGASDVDLLAELPYSVYSQYNLYYGNGQSLPCFRPSGTLYGRPTLSPTLAEMGR